MRRSHRDRAASPSRLDNRLPGAIVENGYSAGSGGSAVNLAIGIADGKAASRLWRITSARLTQGSLIICTDQPSGTFVTRTATLFILTTLAASAQISVLTNRYDNARTATNTSETVLTTTNVNSSRFGKLFSYPVDGSVYAQPLYIPNVITAQGTHNVLYVCTMNDTVYAFDADRNAVLWSVNFTNAAAGITPVPIADITGSDDLNIVGSVGIESTPVIDASTQTLYLLARTKEVSTTTDYVQRLHALDIATRSRKVRRSRHDQSGRARYRRTKRQRICSLQRQNEQPASRTGSGERPGDHCLGFARGR